MASTPEFVTGEKKSNVESAHSAGSLTAAVSGESILTQFNGAGAAMKALMTIGDIKQCADFLNTAGFSNEMDINTCLRFSEHPDYVFNHCPLSYIISENSANGYHPNSPNSPYYNPSEEQRGIKNLEMFNALLSTKQIKTDEAYYLSRQASNPLFMAAARGRVDLVEALLNYGFSIDSKGIVQTSDETMTLLNYVSTTFPEHGDVIKYLEQKANGADNSRSAGAGV